MHRILHEPIRRRPARGLGEGGKEAIRKRVNEKLATMQAPRSPRASETRIRRRRSSVDSNVDSNVDHLRRRRVLRVDYDGVQASPRARKSGKRSSPQRMTKASAIAAGDALSRDHEDKDTPENKDAPENKGAPENKDAPENEDAPVGAATLKVHRQSTPVKERPGRPATRTGATAKFPARSPHGARRQDISLQRGDSQGAEEHATCRKGLEIRHLETLQPATLGWRCLQ